MDEATRHTFQLHLPGLLRVLAEHLYMSKTVAVRELLQNAHDSCVRRRVEIDEPDYQPRIDISMDAARRVLTIHDNGHGLTMEEISTYLSTIGRSYTRELRERLASLSQTEAAALIGQFGFGFLSAFLIASEVTVMTRSAQPGSTGLRWHSSGDEYYTLVPADIADSGTAITLQIKPGASFLLQHQLLIATIQKYADFLPIPIYIVGNPFRVNLMTPPWTALDTHQASIDYIRRAFDSADPLCIIPLHDQAIEVHNETRTLPLSGFLFVPPTSVVSVREYGDVRVFIRHMFICDNERDLLPTWARFVRAVIDCPALQPTASREGVHQDETFQMVQRALATQLAEGLAHLAHEDPTTWRTVVMSHSAIITAWAVREISFFDQVADLVTLRSSRGVLTMPDYLRMTDGTVYYTTQELGSLQEQTLADGYDVPVIDASWFGIAPFLEKYAAQRPGTALVRMDGSTTRLMRPVDDPSFATLLETYRRRGVRARLATFKPMEVPAVMQYPDEADFVQDARRTTRAGDLPRGINELVGAYLDGLTVSDDDLKGILYINAACPLVQRLTQEGIPGDTTRIVLTIIYQTARLFASRTLTPTDVRTAYAEIGTALVRLID